MLACAKNFFALFILLTIPWVCHAEAVSTERSETVEILGNTRTQTFYVLRLVEECRELNDDADFAANPTLLKECLLNSKLFSLVEVEVHERNLRVFVQDRWTLVPLPYLQVTTTGTRSFGGFIIDTNFLGVGDTFGIGGYYASTGSSLFLYFLDRFFVKSFAFALGLRREVFDFQLYSPDKANEDYRETAKEGGVATTYRRGNSIYTVTLSHLSSSYEPLKSDEFPSPSASTRIKLESRYSKTAYRIFYNQGYTLQFAYLRDLWRRDGKASSNWLDVRSFLDVPFFDNVALSLMAEAGISSGGAAPDAPRLGGSKGFRGFEKGSLWAKDYVVAASNIHIPVLNAETGVVTVGSFADVGRVSLIKNHGRLLYCSTGLATYFFLKQIALPGVGVEFGFNTSQRSFFTNFSLGLSF